MSDHETYAYFYVKGFECDPSVITEMLQMSPTKVWRKGDIWEPSKARQRKENAWILKTETSNDDYLTNVHLDQLFSVLLPKKMKVVELSRKYMAGISYVPYCHFSNIAVVLDQRHIKQLASLELGIEFDIYSILND